MAKRAVVVGVNDYSVQGFSNLYGCVADAQSMYHLLIDSFGFEPGQIFHYSNASATRSNILKALRYIVTQSEPGDVACFYFAGHGGRVRADKGKADCDRYYETIIPFAGDHISDFDLNRECDQLQPSVCNLTVILDSCHSGGMSALDSAIKCRTVPYSPELCDAMVRNMKTLVPCGILLPPASHGSLAGNVRNVRSGNSHVDLDADPDKTLVAAARSTLIAACRYTEGAGENSKHGFLTQAFLDLVDKCPFSINHQDLLDDLRTKVAALSGNGQNPQLLGQMNRMTEDFLNGWRDCR